MVRDFLLSFLLTIVTFGSFLLVAYSSSFLAAFILFISLFLFFHSIFTLFWMLYAWENPHDADIHKSPKTYSPPINTFTLLVPARHEEKVIADTISALHNLDYPASLVEALILIRNDDPHTMEKATEEIEKLHATNIRIVTFETSPINKPHALNVGLREAKNNIIAVFDAEDEPHKNILNVANTIFATSQTDVLQSGVQLMNYKSHWYGILNVLEYFFWFKSGLLFFSKVGGVAPLGGNTVFIKKTYLKVIDGWDEHCLTEDADLGIRLTVHGARTRVVYDEEHATHEETPGSLGNFIKQRTRWNQGFLQVIFKADWTALPQFRQRVFAGYILLTPFTQLLFVLFSPILAYVALTQKLPILISMLSITPFFLLIVQLVLQIVMFYEFCKDFKLKSSFSGVVVLLISYVPYQLVLMVSAFRAVLRNSLGYLTWEKTSHANAHRRISIKSRFASIK